MTNRLKTSYGLVILAVCVLSAILVAGYPLKRFNLISQSIFPRIQPAEAALDGAGSGLVGHWTFDEGSGTTAGDSAGSNTGTLTNGPTWNTVDYKVGTGALSFDGVNDWVNLGQSITAFDFSTTTGPYGVNGNRFTISAWVYPSGGSAIQVVHLRGRAEDSSAGYVIYALYKSSATVWSARISDGTNLITLSSASGQLVQNTWQFLTLVWDGTTLRLYKNGVSIGSGTNALFNGIWNHTLDSHRSTVIGAQKNDNRSYWSGKIDDFRAYNRALSAGEIQQLYNLGR